MYWLSLDYVTRTRARVQIGSVRSALSRYRTVRLAQSMATAQCSHSPHSSAQRARTAAMLAAPARQQTTAHRYPRFGTGVREGGGSRGLTHSAMLRRTTTMMVICDRWLRHFYSMAAPSLVLALLAVAGLGVMITRARSDDVHAVPISSVRTPVALAEPCEQQHDDNVIVRRYTPSQDKSYISAAAS